MERNIKIITDSASDLPKEICGKYGIDSIPIMVNAGEASYRDGVDIDIEGLKKLLRTSGIVPKTGVSGPERYLEIYNQYPESDILSVHLGGKFSRAYDTAILAARESIAGHKISTYDSGTASLGLGFMVMEAAALAQDGVDLNTIINNLEDLKTRLAVVAAFQDMNHLRESGRVSHLAGVVGSLLKINPVLRIDNNLISVIDKPRTRTNAVAVLNKFADDFGCLERAAVLHFGCQTEAENLATDIQRLPMKNKDIMICELGPALACHGGVGTLGLCLIKQKK
ncbi:DegV family protein [Candidatus Roizmanbacteria bacterium]|jgi:DegV family protein with EDD domain|nr:DegV family protein [Candidatus Roizmanbacteria bacterium]